MPEHDDKDGTRKAIAALYQCLLLRPADEAGLEGYTTLVQNDELSFEAVLDRLLRSDEFQTNFGTFEAHYADPAKTRFTKDSSQYGEIGLLIRRMVNASARHRIVVDVGVRGRDGSNSYDLLRHFGWKGLLIEANPRLAEGILQEFAGLEVSFVSSAVSDYAGEAEFFLGTNDAISSLNEEATAGWGPVRDKIRVPVRRLPDILTDYAIPFDFDLLSVDIEGEDIKVLNDMIDRSDYRPIWVIIEASYDFKTEALTDLPFSRAVIDQYEIVDRTSANLLLKRR